jgi:hypothetical protein
LKGHSFSCAAAGFYFCHSEGALAREESAFPTSSASGVTEATRTVAMAKRKIFDELMEGVAAMKSHRTGKLKLRTVSVTPSRGANPKATEAVEAKRDKNPPKKHGNMPL